MSADDDQRDQEISLNIHRGVDPYLRMPSATINDKGLGWRALGILTFMLNLPPNWKFRLSNLSKRRVGHGNGRSGISAGMKELAEAGYLKIEIDRSLGRVIGTIWHVADHPEFKKAQAGSQSPPGVEFLNTEILNTENPTLGITERAGTTKEGLLHAPLPPPADSVRAEKNGDEVLTEPQGQPQDQTSQQEKAGSSPPPVAKSGKFTRPHLQAGVICWDMSEFKQVASLIKEHGEGEVMDAAKKIAEDGRKPYVSYISKILKGENNGNCKRDFIANDWVGQQPAAVDSYEAAIAGTRADQPQPTV